MTIDGGQRIALDGQSRVRVLYVNPEKTLHLIGITITRGYREGDFDNTEATGAGIWNRGQVTVANSVFSFNSGNYGGAIINDANNQGSSQVTLRVTNSTFYGNSAIHGFGGAIYVRGGNVAVTNSTFYENFSDAEGGGIHQLSGTTTVTNSTFSGNFSPEGGAIKKTFGTLTLKNSIIADSPAGNNCAETADPPISADSSNIDTDGSCGGATGYLPLQIKLGSLSAGNGGPTPTMALGEGSVAIDHAPTSSCVAAPVNGLDQRGYGRNVDGDGAISDNECDVGAYEYGAVPDPTPPVTTIAAYPAANANGWNNSAVQLTASATDEVDGSGVAETRCVLDPAGEPVSFDALPAGNCSGATASTEGAHTFYAASMDKAGNQETPVQSVWVQIDTSKPMIVGSRSPGPNAQSWNNTDVTVSFACTDSLSGVASCGPDQTLSGEGAGQGVIGTALDKAGNSLSATVGGIRIDKTAPLVTVTGVTDGAIYILGSAPAAGCSTSDTLSGVLSQATASVIGGTSKGVGSFSASCAGALDNAGNPGAESASFSVVYPFSGFFQPVDNAPTVNVATAGSSIPVKFSLSGDQGLDIFAAGYPISQATACPSSSTDVIEQTVTASVSGLTYEAATDTYNYVWKTDKAWKGKCRQLIVNLNDGTTHLANFQFK